MRRGRPGPCFQCPVFASVEFGLFYIHLRTIVIRFVEGEISRIPSSQSKARVSTARGERGRESQATFSETPSRSGKYFRQQMASARLVLERGVATAWSEAFCYSNDNVHRLQLSGNLY